MPFEGQPTLKLARSISCLRIVCLDHNEIILLENTTLATYIYVYSVYNLILHQNLFI